MQWSNFCKKYQKSLQSRFIYQYGCTKCILAFKDFHTKLSLLFHHLSWRGGNYSVMVDIEDSVKASKKWTSTYCRIFETSHEDIRTVVYAPEDRKKSSSPPFFHPSRWLLRLQVVVLQMLFSQLQLSAISLSNTTVLVTIKERFHCSMPYLYSASSG